MRGWGERPLGNQKRQWAMRVPNVVATTYMMVNSSGRNRPCIFSCVNEDSLSEDYFVKFHGAVGPLIICEFIGSLLGQALGVDIPPVAIVHIDEKMNSAIQDADARNKFQAKPGPHFGSRNIGQGFTVMNSGYSLTSDTIEQALDIFAFDMLIQNTDRSSSGAAGNPNLLFKGNQLVAIDHEMSFSFINFLGEVSFPWNLRETNLPQRHIFYSQLYKHAKNNTVSFDRFIQKLAGISPEYMDSVMQAIPPEWYNERYVKKIAQHMDLLLTNMGRFHRGLLEVFA